MNRFGLFSLTALIPLLSMAADFVTYEEFGAIGDGKTDDMPAIVAAHAAANAKGLPIKANDAKTYYIGATTKTAIIQTDVDFGQAKFIIDDTVLPLKDRDHELFQIRPTTPCFSVKGIPSLTRGQTRLEATLPGPCLMVAKNRKVKHYIREGANQNNGVPQQETFLVAADGTIDATTPIRQDLATVSELIAYPLDTKPITVKGGIFTTRANQAESRYTYYKRNFLIKRANTTLMGLTHYVTGELDHGAPYSSFLNVQEAADVTIRDCLLTAHKTYYTIGNAGVKVGMGSYDLGANTSIRVSFVNCRQTTDINDSAYWGLFGSNFCRDLLLDNCTISRFDAHMGVGNATIRNSHLGYVGINAIGTGTLLVENTTVEGSNLINLRPDYGCTWEGEFIIRNCVFKPRKNPKRPVRLINAWNRGLHDFGYTCYMPRKVTLDGLKIEDEQASSATVGPFIFADYNKQTTDTAEEKFHYHPTEEVVLKNVTTTSGKALQTCSNPHLFRNLKITRQ
ncbi:MAG: right-handed parallel beta-helix repeat-containing protein [Kiritimatiellae bacterium]|nr:right-handed parallel beta-helix repeat-containing protein [Kiritimatiellia bacterium]